MSGFFGAIFRAIGILIMLATSLWGIFLLFVMLDIATHPPHHSAIFFYILIFLFGMFLPFRLGLLLDRLGKRLHKNDAASHDDEEAPAPAVREKPSRFVPRRQTQEVELDVQMEPAPELEPYNASKPAKTFHKPDPTAMGVDTFEDPDKKGNYK